MRFDTFEGDYTHEGDRCTFGVMIKRLGLRDRGLSALAEVTQVINAADTNNLDADPLATGFEAIAVGYSLRFPDDLENINRQFEVCDALYAWYRLDIARKEM